ncbi:unnamed protein product [Amoebophrya sp. A25]|nr:unnamed protein product [Amoebophrya sp. A25]|eukprot:GSA25T00001792001.1
MRPRLGFSSPLLSSTWLLAGCNTCFQGPTLLGCAFVVLQRLL